LLNNSSISDSRRAMVDSISFIITTDFFKIADASSAVAIAASLRFE